MNLPRKVPKKDVDLFLKECRLAGYKCVRHETHIYIGEASSEGMWENVTLYQVVPRGIRLVVSLEHLWRK